MTSFSYRIRCAALAGAFICALGVTAPEAAAIRTGVLDCRVSGSVGFIVGSTRTGSCVYRPSHGHPEFYTGTVDRLGLDVGVSGEGRSVWAVFSAQRIPQPFALAGRYAGVGASASFGPGASANVIVGGNNNSISLQPLALGVKTGINLAAGVGSLTLQPVVPSR